MRLLAFLCALITLTASPAFAQLRWEDPAQQVLARLFEKQRVLKYRFTNAGTAPLAITDVATSCGCTTTALAKTEYYPGESGELEVTIVFGAKAGKQERMITVTTTETLDHPQILRLLVEVPAAVRVDPEFVYWPLGERAAPKVIRVVVAEENPAKIVSMQSNNPGVRMIVREVRPGKEMEITVAPEDVDRAQNATFVIHTAADPLQNPATTHYAYLVVK